MDKDLQAKQEARDLSKQAEIAQKELFSFSQEKLNTITEAVAKAFAKEAFPLAELAVRETGFGNSRDKITKNEFCKIEFAKSSTKENINLTICWTLRSNNFNIVYSVAQKKRIS